MSSTTVIFLSSRFDAQNFNISSATKSKPHLKKLKDYDLKNLGKEEKANLTQCVSLSVKSNVGHLPYNVIYVVSVHPLQFLSRKAHSNYVGINICSAELRKTRQRHFWSADSVAANKNGYRHSLESSCAFSARYGLRAYFISADS